MILVKNDFTDIDIERKNQKSAYKSWHKRTPWGASVLCLIPKHRLQKINKYENRKLDKYF